MPRKSNRKAKGKVPKKVRNYVKAVIHSNIENKIIAYAPVTVQPLSSAIVQYELNGLALGTSPTTRVGGSVKMLSTDLRFTMSPNVSASPVLTPTRIRLILFWNRQCNGTLLPAAQLLQNPSAGLNITSPLNYLSRDRYTVLHDKVYSLGYGGDLVETRILKFTKIIKNLKRATTTYASNGSTVADIVKNSLELMIMTDATANAPIVVWQGRSLFEDA